MKEVIKRMQSETPTFFKVLRTIGVGLAAVGGTLLASPVVLPAAVVSAGGYLLVAGTVLTAVCQATTKGE